LGKSRARRIAELSDTQDQKGVQSSTERLSAQLQGPCSNLRLVKIEARINDPSQADEAAEWSRELMASAYADTKPYRRLRVLINPIGGPGKAVSLFQSRVQPIFEAAGCTVDATITTHAFHGTQIAQALDLSSPSYDAIVCVSGDGMLHEVLNGLARHPKSKQALQIPLVPIPAGSGNAVAVNLLGATQGFNLALASLNAIKGKPMPLDICSVTQPLEPDESLQKRQRGQAATSIGSASPSVTNLEPPEADPSSLNSPNTCTYDIAYSFLSQAIGLMADVDLGTEDMRMLGDTRFIIGFLGGIITNKQCEVDLYVKLGEKGSLNKADMRKRVLDAHAKADGASQSVNGTVTVQSDEQHDALGRAKSEVLRNGSVMDELPDGPLNSLPQLVPLDPSWNKTVLETSPDAVTSAEPDRWYRVNAPISALYAGKIPYVSRDLLQFPFALPHDRCIDLALMLHNGGRMSKLRGIASAETGALVYDPAVVYVKCEAYRVVPHLQPGHKRLKKGGLVSIDGEHKPYKPFQVEVSDDVQMRILSLFGQWQVGDVAPPSDS
jgi:sphingosine kinase